jgi:hypothetical protein
LLLRASCRARLPRSRTCRRAANTSREKMRLPRLNTRLIPRRERWQRPSPQSGDAKSSGSPFSSSCSP